jgi:hypothetical protein
MTRLVVALTVVFATVATFAAQTPTTPTSATYVGSQACQRCHAPTYERWSKTRMANVVRDPKAHPDAVLPDFSKPDPLLTFKLSDVAFVYGSRWKQRYFTKVGDDYFPQPAQWDVTHRVWRPYFVQPNTDWWVPHYPADNMKRPTGPLCDGCHSVNYDVKTHSVTEWNVGCEKCHGPGSEHVRQPTARNIVNPAKLDFVRANDTCIQCHSQGQPLQNPIEGRYYDWPVGFQQGGNLKDFWKLEEYTLGETTFTHFADGTAHKNRMQGNDFVESLMYRRGVTCFSCHDARTSNPADLVKSWRVRLTPPPGRRTVRARRRSSSTRITRAGSPASEHRRHMPKIEQTIADVNVRSHTFSSARRADARRCQYGDAPTRATPGRDALPGRPDVSPWRVP